MSHSTISPDRRKRSCRDGTKAFLTAGAIGDRVGRRRALLAGFAVFAVGSAVAGTATAAP
jgi:MFS family permease